MDAGAPLSAVTIKACTVSYGIVVFCACTYFCNVILDIHSIMHVDCNCSVNCKINLMLLYDVKQILQSNLIQIIQSI